MNRNPSVRKLILVPAVITLVVTLLRLIGELQGWSPTFFDPEPGGGGALFGIWLLVPVFGIYFALKLAKAGQGPPSGWKVALRAAIVLFVITGIVYGVLGLVSNVIGSLLTMGVLVLGTTILAMKKPWPALYSTLIAYALAARLPVAFIMFFAFFGDWGTHYDGPPPNFPETGPLVKWLVSGLWAQMTFWISFTIIFGMLFGGLAAGLRKSFS